MSEHRSGYVQDRLVAPTEPGYRSSRRAASPPPPPYDDPPRGRRGGDAGGGRMRVLAWVSIVVTGLMVVGALTGYTLLRSTLSGFREKPIDIINPRPANMTGALNVLLVGSDTRAGEGNAQYGQADARKIDAGGKRTDTMIMMHISPKRDKATLISFPRDSMVDIPQCKKDGDANVILPPQRNMINSAYNSGGINCTITTIETLTQIRIDHFVEVDFSGFKNIVDALGGIQVCLKTPVDDKLSKLTLAAGNHTLMGEQALGYVRLRKYGDGSDIQRIKRQQLFLTQVVKKATSSDLLGDPGRLLSFMNAATQSVTMDPALAGDIGKLVEIANSARSLTSSGVKFITVPWMADPENPKARVVWDPVKSGKLFAAIRSDVDLPTATPSASASASAKPKVAIKPGQVQIQVLNGTGTTGKAKEVADGLTAQGFHVVGLGNATAAGAAPVPATKLLYAKKSPDDADYAGAVTGKLLSKATVTGGKIKPSSTQPYTPPPGSPTFTPTPDAPVIQLVVGTDFEGVKAPTEIPDEIKKDVISADTKSICT